MNRENDYHNNPLHGVGLKGLLVELVDHYGFEILFAYLNVNCFKNKPSIASSVKFLKKTEWAREKVEGFYLYEFKNLPKASPDQFLLPPRERVFPEGQTPREPAVLSLEDAERLSEKRARKAAAHGHGGRRGAGQGIGAQGDGDPGGRDDARSRSAGGDVWGTAGSSADVDDDPWANWKKKHGQ